MNQKLLTIFNNFNIEFDQDDLVFFDNAHIEGDITISKEKKKGYLTLAIPNFLPVRLVQLIDHKLATNPIIKTKIIFNVKYQFVDQELINDYIEFIKKYKSQHVGGAWNFISQSTINLDLDNSKIQLLVESLSQQKGVEKEVEYLSNKMKQYGFKHLVFEIKLNLPEIDAIAQRELNYQQMAAEQATIKKEINHQINQQKTTYNPVQSNGAYRRQAVKMDTPSYEKLIDIEEDAQNVVIHGMVMKLDSRMSKSGRQIYSMAVTDYTSSIKATYFGKNEGMCLLDQLTEDEKAADNAKENDAQRIHIGDWIALKGRIGFNQYDQEVTFTIDNFQKIEKEVTKRKDTNELKRVELHTHTKMSVMDGISHVSDYLKQADEWGWNAIAITDHTNVQSFPDAFASIKSINKKRKEKKLDPMKLIYGSEVTMLEDEVWYVKNDKNQKLREAKFVIFDLETTGLSPELDEIIEFGAVIYDYKTGQRIKKDILIKPFKELKEFTKELTHITDEMLANKPTIDQIFGEIYTILEDAILVAHNANFDFNFLQSYAKKLGYPELTNTVIDTLTISRALYPMLKNHRLGTVAKKTGILYDDKIAHRGDYDADVLTDVYEHMWHDAKNKYAIDTDTDWKKVIPIEPIDNMNYVRSRGFHTTILAKNQTGLKELYQIISYSHTQSLLGSPKIFKSKLNEIRQTNNLLIGTSCVNGEIFDLARTNTFDVLDEKIKFYDYVEIQPLSVYKNLCQNGSLTEEELKLIIRMIIRVAKDNNKLIVASSDAHYVDPELKLIRQIYINAKGLGGVRHPLFDYKDRVKDFPDQHLRTTQEMLDEFAWLNDEQLVHEMVIENTNKIANLVDENIFAIQSGTFNPHIDNVDILLKEECYKTAHSMYGQELPPIVATRLERELDSIIKHGFGVIYWISHKLVEKSLQDGYLVGSRGSVGSSFVATMSKITEVNPLRAHYRCLNCQYSDFSTPSEFKCGYDLPKQKCPKCSQILIGDGHDIPFETFLGFDGDKVPDIDLNFSGEYQAQAHNFTKTMFGENNVFRAGTISTVAAKTAFGYVKNYFEEKQELANQPRKVEVERIASLAEGVKRTTGQHPGGIIILPKEYEIEDFTPINYPADDINGEWKTTHFDFHSIHDNLLKMDILGHVDPTALKMLQDLTGVDPITIPTNDEKVYSLFSTTKALDITSDQINNEITGAIGIPEFGTSFVRTMLKDTKPKNFADLVQISGLSHGTDVYLGNAATLIKQGLANISSVIGCRDDIMVYLLTMGLEPSLAFSIMESVRKGKGLTSTWINTMKVHNVPDWYIDSCLKIKYMFPKAHATAYVLMAYRVAWFKIYYPIEYYATYLSTRADAFDLETSLKGYDGVLQKLREYEGKVARNDANAKEQALITVFEVQLEMLSRGIKMMNIDFNQSLGSKFKVVFDEKLNQKVLYPPFNIIDSLGETVAQSIINAREVKQFASLSDLKKRTQVTQTQLKIFENLGITDSLSNDEQLTFEF